MFLGEVKRLFEKGSVCVTGIRGSGKDMLLANVVIRRGKKYISNIDYGGEFVPFNVEDYLLNGNTYDNFINGNVRRYIWPHGDGVDTYVSDIGVYFPSQYCNELNRKYVGFPFSMALYRQLAQGEVHFNVQHLPRAWDKLREQSETYIRCNWILKSLVKLGLCVQKITIYERYQSCVDRVRPFRLRAPLNPFSEKHLVWEMERDRFDQTYGIIKSGILIYRNKSKYDTRFFKEMLENGEE